MTLPNLPKINKKQEANFSIQFRHWLMANPIKFQCWFEMKDTRGKKTFRLAEWKQEQRQFSEALKHSEKGILVRTEGTVGLPDYKYAYKEPTLVVIKYPQGFVLIEAENLAFSKKKTLNWEEAKGIAHITVD
jgi:hypothetical protein